MKKAALITGAALALLLVASAFALGSFGQNGATSVERGTYHDQMSQILESGTYEDLEALRAETGMPMAPWVTDDATFQQLKEHHEAMEESGECPMMNGAADGECPMMNGQRRGMHRQGHGMASQDHASCPMMK